MNETTIIQVKCGICDTVFSIDAEKYCNKNDIQPSCFVCGNAVPAEIINHIQRVAKNDFGGWEIGTYFKD